MQSFYKRYLINESDKLISLDVGHPGDVVFAVVSAPNVESVIVTDELRLLVKDGVLDLYGSQINTYAGKDIAPGVIKTLEVGVYHFNAVAEYIVNTQALMDEFQSKIDEQVKKFEDFQVLMDEFQSKIDEQVKKFEEFQVLMDGFQSKIDEQVKKFEEFQVLMDEFQFKIDEQAKKFEDMQELVDGIQSKVDEQVKKFEEFQVLMDAFQSKVDEHDKKFEEMQVLMDAFQSKVDEHEKKIMDMQIALDLLFEVELVALKKKDDEIMMKNYSQDLQMKGNFEVLSNELYLLKTQLDKLEARLK